MNRVIFAVVALMLYSVLFAQTPNPYNGSWGILLEGFERAKVEGTLTVKDEGGTWSTTASARNDPCIGRDTPITVQAVSEDGLALKVNRSQVLTGCPDFSFKFKKVDEKTMKAELTGGRSVTLTRK